MKKTVLKWIGIGVGAFILLGIIAVASDDGKSTTEQTSAASTDSSEPTERAYTIAKENNEGDDLYYRITVDDRYDKADLIEILRKLKTKAKPGAKVVAWFYIKQFTESGAWATAAYLNECTDCEAKDKEGNPVKWLLIGLRKSQADSLQQLSLDTIPNKQLIGSYLEDITRCKTELYFVNGDESRILQAQLYEPGSRVLSWLKLKKVAGEDRYMFEDDDEGNYLLLETGNRTAHFRNAEGKEWHTFKY